MPIPKQKNFSILTADKLRYYYAGPVEAQGNVVLTQPDLRFQASYLRLSGKELRDISAKGDIYAIDYERKNGIGSSKITI